MISKTMRAILHTLSYGNIEVESSRRLVDIKKLDAMNIFLKKMDIQIFNGDYEIPLRIYFPTEEAMTNGVEKGHTFPVLLFFHGGGWVTESVDTYNRVCARMSQSTGHIVVSVEYRLAPEYRFPTALMDCYAAAKALYTNNLILNTDSRRITVPEEILQPQLLLWQETRATFRYSGRFLFIQPYIIPIQPHLPMPLCKRTAPTTCLLQ